MGDVPPLWVMGSLPKKTRVELDDWLDLMEKRGVQVPRSTLRKKDDIVRFIEAERRVYWDAWHRDRPMPATQAVPKRASAGFSGITASECDAWLRTLPPVPLHGDTTPLSLNHRRPSMDSATSVQAVAQRLLAAYDAFMSDEGMTPEQIGDDRAVRNGAIYGAAAFVAAPDHEHGAHAMARSFLLALIDPLHPDLDYLRADPASGQVARDARAASEAQANEAANG